MKNHTLITLAVVLSGGLLISQASGGLPVGSERLYSVTFSEKNLTIRVKSYGCTKAANFEVSVDRKNVLTVLRTKADLCRAMPRVIELQLPLPDLAEGDYRIMNAFVYKR